MKKDMDYEKKYNEALKWMRELYPGLQGATKEDAEHYFPELCESEDERIRKALILHLQSFYSNEVVAPGISKEMAIAWLEKKKEQKPILEVFGFKVGDAVRLKDGDGRKHIIKSFEEVEGVHGPNFYHVEFEDNSARDGIYPGEEYPNGYYTQMEKFEKEQKPAEWSEEDERILKGIIGKIDHDQTYGVSKAEMLSFLKDNRPSWKPSDHQMNILKAVKEYVGRGSGYWGEGLGSLIEDLEKLM